MAEERLILSQCNGILCVCVLGKQKGGHKGRAKHYLTQEEIDEQEQRKKREAEWKVES